VFHNEYKVFSPDSTGKNQVMSKLELELRFNLNIRIRMDAEDRCSGALLGLAAGDKNGGPVRMVDDLIDLTK
jgi:hypothetical protein